MSKKEAIWREILVRAREKRQNIFTQKGLAADFGFSLSTVFNALKVPRETHSIEVGGRNFRLLSYEKLLYILATHRNIKKDMLTSGFSDHKPKEIESLVPPETTFGLYSVASLLYHTEPAEYDHVYVYADDKNVSHILERVGGIKNGAHPNIFIMQKDPWLARYPSMPLEQILVDIWNAPEWYAKDFIAALKEKLPFHD